MTLQQIATTLNEMGMKTSTGGIYYPTQIKRIVERARHEGKDRGQCQHHRWHSYQTKHNERDAFNVAKRRAASTKKRHRLVDEAGRLIDLIDP